MRIHKVAATGMKGPGFRHQTTPLTFITGDNGSGKTAITDAIKIALLGRHPVLGAKNAAIMELANGDLLEIELALGQGDRPVTTLRYAWKRKGKTVKSEGGPDEDQKQMLEGIIPACLDFDAFASAKPTERQRILEAAMQDSEDQEQAVIDQMAGMNRRALMAIESATTPWDKRSFQSFEATCAQAKREVGQDVKRLTAALQQSMVDEATELMARDTNAINPEELEKAEKALEEISLVIGAQTERVNAIAEAQMRAPEEPEDPRPDIIKMGLMEERIAKNLKALQKARQIAEHNAPINERVRAIDRALKNAPEQAPTKPVGTRPTPEQIREVQDEMRKGEQQAAQAQEGINAAERAARSIKAERDRLAKAGQCPMCGTAGERLEAAIAEVFGAKLGANKAAMQDAQERLQKAQGAKEEAGVHLTSLNREQAAWDQWDAHLQAEELRAEREAIEKDLKPILATDDHYQLDRERTAANKIQKEWDAFDAARDKIPSKEEATDQAQKLRALQGMGADIRKQVEDLKLQRASYNDALARVRNQTRHQEELEIARAGEKGLANAAAWAKQQSLEATARALQPILDPANRILHGVIAGKLEIDGTDIGIRRVGFHRLETLSGAEAATVAIAVQVALASKSEVRTIIADELSRLRPERKVQLAKNLRQAIERGDIEQAILLDHDPMLAQQEATSDDCTINCGATTNQENK